MDRYEQAANSSRECGIFRDTQAKNLFLFLVHQNRNRRFILRNAQGHIAINQLDLPLLALIS